MERDEQLSPELFQRLLKRERASRKEAERLLDQKSIELYDTNQRLRALADELELRVERRTAELEEERNRALEVADALRKSQSRFSDMANIVGEYLWECDTDFVITSVTGHVASVLGYLEDELIGRSIFDYMSVEDAMQMRAAFAAAAQSHSVVSNFMHRSRTKDNSTIWQRTSGAPQYDASGKLNGYRGASLDVSEQERSKQQMQQLVLALQHASEAIVMTNAAGQIQFCNQACARMFRYGSVDALLGTNWTEFYKPDEARRFEQAISTKFGVGESHGGEGVGLRKNGDEFPAHFSFNRLPDGGLLWICRDETERVDTLMSLQTQNSLLSALLENIRVGVLFEDAESEHKLIWNEAISRILRLNTSVLAEAQTVQAIFGLLRERCADAAALDEILELREKRYNLQLQLEPECYLVFDRVPVFVGTTYRGALWTVRDVSEEKRQARVMEEARLRAESGDRAKSTFLANMSHEIRTPLNGICGMARILMQADLTRELLDQVRGIQISADSLLHVLNDILDFSKVEAGQIDIELVDFELAHVFDSAFAVLQGRAVEKALHFDLIYPEADLPTLRGDPSRLSEILLNLLGNSIKFTSSGSVTLMGRVLSRDLRSLQMEFTIRDTGIGMSPEEMAHVFEPFVQADSSINRRFGGSGLGLSICRDLVQLMGGSLSVESEPNKGTTFSVQMPYDLSVDQDDSRVGSPLQLNAYIITESQDFYRMCRSMLTYTGITLLRATDVADVIARHRESKGILLVDRSLTAGYRPAEDPSLTVELPAGMHRILISEMIPPGAVKTAEMLTYPFSRYRLISMVHALLHLPMPSKLFQNFDASQYDDIDMSGLRVLVAEDNTINQKVALMTIERFGATVHLAANGLEVLELVERFEYDLILMDIRMPEMDGVEACSKVRSLGLKVPIFALTADAMRGDRERFLQAGMDGYLSKPLVEADLVNLVMNSQCINAGGTEAPMGASTQKESQADDMYQQATGLQVLDLDGFYDLLSGNKELAHDLLRQFAEHCDAHIMQGHEALQAGNLDIARGIFHKLAGSAATVCAQQLRAYCLSLERSLMESPPNLNVCIERLPDTREAVQRLHAEIEALLKI